MANHISAKARVDRKTKHLAIRIQRGEIAVIDHVDLDSTCARMLLDRRIGAVINASPSISKRYPNTGPRILADAGIPIIDNVGKEIMTTVLEGDELEIEGDTIWRHGAKLASGVRLTQDEITRLMDASRENLSEEIAKFAENTLMFVQQEKSLVLDPIDVPALKTRISGRHALIVVRGEGFRQDLGIIRSYVQDMKPILIGVDGGADALVDFGLKPDLIVGDMDSVRDDTLKCGAELVVHAYGNGSHEAPGLARVKSLGLEAAVFPIHGTSEDMAMLLAYEEGAELIVAVGSHSNLIDFLDKGRAGMASTFLTRLRVGSKLVDAKGVSRLYRNRPASKDLLLLFAAAAVPILVVAFQSPAVRTYVSYAWFQLGRHLHF
jgi:uncharacterized membrane-anchored protein